MVVPPRIRSSGTTVPSRVHAAERRLGSKLGRGSTVTVRSRVTSAHRTTPATSTGASRVVTTDPLRTGPIEPRTVRPPSSPSVPTRPGLATADPSGPPTGTTTEAGSEPSASPGTSSLRWVGLPPSATTAPTTAVVAQGPGAAARPSSSATMASSTIPAPWPPSSSGSADPEAPLGAQIAPERRKPVGIGVESGPGHLRWAPGLRPSPERNPQVLVLLPDADGHAQAPKRCSRWSIDQTSHAWVPSTTTAASTIIRFCPCSAQSLIISTK